MSDILQADDMFDGAAEQAGDVIEDATGSVGMTSEESGDSSANEPEKKSRISKFTVFDSLLLMSLICITLATLNMFLELNSFGSILSGEFPWRVSDFLK